MRIHAIALSVVVLSIGPATASAQKTEVSVEKGKVVAETGTRSVAVESGWKAVLTPGKEPIVTVDDPLVDAVMELYKCVEVERQARKETIKSIIILIMQIDEENRSRMAVLNEVPNTRSEPASTYRIEDVAILGEPQFYDMQGRVLSFDFEQRNMLRADYVLHFPAPIKAGESFRYTCVSSLRGIVWLKEDPLWVLSMSAGQANCLAYHRVILPASAIFVDSSRPVTMVDASEGRVGVTVRSYSRSASESVSVAFLWPDKDGKTLTDLPARYLDLREDREEKIVRESRLRVARILAGESFTDQSSPPAALLSLYSVAVRKDSAGLLNLMAPGLRGIAAGHMDQIMGVMGGIEDFQLLGTPEWPKHPSKGCEHPVYLAREGSLICEATLVMVWEDGKWYLQGLEAGRTRDTARRPYRSPETTSSGR